MNFFSTPVAVAGGIGTEAHFKEGTDSGGIGTVGLVKLITGSFKLGTVSLEVGTVGKSGVKVNFNRRQIVEVQIKFNGELDVSGQSSFGVTHQNGEGIQRNIVGVIGVDHIHVGTVHQDLKVQHIAQGNGTGLEFVIGVFQRDLLEFAVFFGNAALGNGQKNVVIGLSNGIHHLAAVVGIHRLGVFNTALFGENVEFTGQTVKKSPVDAQTQVGAEAVCAGVVTAGNTHIFSSPEPGVAVGKGVRGSDFRCPGTHRLIVAETGRFYGMMGGNVGRIVLESDFLSLIESQFCDAVKEFVGLIFFTVSVAVPQSCFGNRSIVVAAPDGNCGDKSKNSYGKSFCLFHKTEIPLSKTMFRYF